MRGTEINPTKIKIMNSQTKAVGTDLNNLAADTQDLVSSAVDAAGKHVRKAGKQLSEHVDTGKALAIDGMSAVDDAVRKFPYYAIGICVLGGIGLGLGVGILVAQGFQAKKKTVKWW